jgi:sortase A
MKADSKTIRIVERGLLLLGLLLLTIFALAHLHRFIMLRAEMARFEAKKLDRAKEGDARKEAFDNANDVKDHHQTRNADYSLWSVQRIESYERSLSEPSESLAVLRIPKLHLEVPVLNGTNEFTLNRGVGRIAGTSLPGQDGNIGIAGHRDGFFRGLKDISTGDAIELITTSGTDVYVVDQILITSPADVRVLRARTKRSLTLVTCYPFYFVGPAPSRYIVEASLKQ